MLKYSNYQVLRKLTIIPAMLWLSLLFIIPVSMVLIFSFFQTGTYGNIVYTFTLKNFEAVLDPNYYKAVTRTFFMAISNAILCLIVAYPMAYYISSRQHKGIKNALLLLTLLPFWTNFLIRTYAWLTLLGNTGLINKALIHLHIVDQPVELLFTPFAVQLGLLYNYLPFMILPLYASIEKIDQRYYWAAADLGAGPLRTFWHVTFPLSLTGMLTGLFFVFIPSLGEYIIPDLLGGAKTALMGNIIKDQYMSARNWPLGSTLVFLMMLIILMGLILRKLVFKTR